MHKLSTATFINAHKILVTPLVLGLMSLYSNWSTEAFVYLALHGTYSLLWLLKQTYFPDRRFAERLPFWIGVGFVFIPLAGYYLAPYLLISRRVTLPPYVFAIVLVLYITGIFFHYVSDAQKFYILRERKGLIDDGLFTTTRNLRSWFAMRPTTQSARCLPSCFKPCETTNFANRLIPATSRRSGRRWPSSLSRNVAMLKA